MIEQQQGRVQYVQFGRFLQFPELVHGIFTRQGGYSEAPVEGLNVAISVGDSVDNVIRNRLLALQALGIEHYPCATLWLVHGADVVALNNDIWEDWQADWLYRSYFIDEQELTWTTRPRHKADAIITTRRGVALVMSSADCVPLMLYDAVRGAIGLAHAGWRGTARGIALATVEAMVEQSGSRPGDIYAGIGPSIGPCCYEVTETVKGLLLGQIEFDTMSTRERYRNLVRESAVFSIKEMENRSSLRLDLWKTNRNQLLMAGLVAEHIELPDICTGCEKERFYSHRGEHGKAGRFPSILALREK